MFENIDGKMDDGRKDGRTLESLVHVHYSLFIRLMQVSFLYIFYFKDIYEIYFTSWITLVL